MPAAPHIVLNGAGLVGSLAAIYMLQFSSNVTVVEKRSDLRKASYEAGRSINLILTSRGLFALRAVGLEKAALALCVPVQGRIIHTAATNDHVFQPYGVSQSEVNYSVNRTLLNVMLISEAEKLGVKFVFQHEVEHIDFHNSTATYLNGATQQRTQIKADLFLGTDGVGSPTRQLMLEQLRCEGVLATDKMERLGISYKELTFPTTADKQYSMESRGLHIWPRGPAFLMALADQTSTFTGTLYLPDGSATLNIPGIETMPSFEQLGNSEAVYESYIKEVYPDIPKLVPDYAKQLSSRGHSFLATLKTSHWFYKSKAVVIGDAGTGIVPFFGQGMNLGFESLVVLVRFMRRFGCDANGLELAFAAYEKYHKVSAHAILNMAVENFTEMSYKVGLPEFLMRKQIENAVETRLPKLFRSRYYMVTKTLVPYATVQEAGHFVETVVDVIIALLKERKLESSDVDKLSTEELTAVVDKHFSPFIQKHSIRLGDTLAEYYPSPIKSKQ